MSWSEDKELLLKVNHRLQLSKKNNTYQYSNSLGLLQYKHKYGTPIQN